MVSRPVLAVAALLISGAASAQPAVDPRATAVELFDTAEKLLQEGKTSDACPKYGASYRLDPQLGVALYYADCLEKDGRFASAYAAFREARDLAQSKGDERRAIADERARALEPRLSRITMDVPASARLAGLEVLQDGIVLDEATWGTALPVDPGEHRIEARAPGRKPWRTTITIARDASVRRVEVPFLLTLDSARAEAPVPAPMERRSSTPDRGVESSGGGQRTLGYVVGGTGLAGVAVGAVFLVQREKQLDERDELCPSGEACAPGTNAKLHELTEDARSAQTFGFASLAAGGAAVALGTVLVLTAPKHAVGSQGARLTFSPLLGARGAGIAVGGSL